MMIVEDKAYIKMMKMMNANVVIPGRKLVSRDIKAVYKISKAHVKRIIAATPGRLHEMMDGWSSPNVLSVLGVAATFMKDNEMITIVLDCLRYVAYC